jgi:hypothetical protein
MNSSAMLYNTPCGEFHVSSPGAYYDLETKVVMADGTQRVMRDIKAGDQVMGDDGTPRTVLDTFNDKRDKMYKLKRNDDPDKYIIVSGEHMVPVKADGVEPYISVATGGAYFTYYTICTNSKICDNVKCNKHCVRKVVVPFKNLEHAKIYLKQVFEDPPVGMLYDGDMIEVSVEDYMSVLKKE